MSERHCVEKRRIRFNDEIVTAEVYLFNGQPMEVFIDGIDTPLDARFVEFLGEDALDNVVPKCSGAI